MTKTIYLSKLNAVIKKYEHKYMSEAIINNLVADIEKVFDIENFKDFVIFTRDNKIDIKFNSHIKLFDDNRINELNIEELKLSSSSLFF